MLARTRINILFEKILGHCALKTNQKTLYVCGPSIKSLNEIQRHQRHKIYSFQFQKLTNHKWNGKFNSFALSLLAQGLYNKSNPTERVTVLRAGKGDICRHFSN